MKNSKSSADSRKAMSGTGERLCILQVLVQCSGVLLGNIPAQHDLTVDWAVNLNT